MLQLVKQYFNLFKRKESLRFFPPNFQFRNIGEEVVKSAFKQQQQVVAVVFNVHSNSDLTVDEIIEEQLLAMNKEFIEVFSEIIKRHFTEEEILFVDSACGSDFLLLLKVNAPQTFLIEIDERLNKLSNIIKNITSYDLQPGFMFVEQGNNINEAIQKAYSQARLIALKRVSSEYSEMNFEINDLISKKNIELLAQPIIHLETDTIHAWEILTRGPERGDLTNPLKLFTIAKQMNLLYELELIVLEKSLQQVIDNQCKELVFINLIPITLGDDRFYKDVMDLFIKYPCIKPEQFVFEITERESIEVVPNLLANVKQLRAEGFRFAVDDTGAGYASLHTISQIMPDIIKIDRSVIENIDSNKIKETMLKGLLGIAKELEAIVVAEGIETRAEAAVLSRNQVPLAQGFYFAKPNKMPNMST
jgi:EAL domain-containing protein (putative c-di-GMP-specific phosphodiesterase class I)